MINGHKLLYEVLKGQVWTCEIYPQQEQAYWIDTTIDAFREMPGNHKNHKPRCVWTRGQTVVPINKIILQRNKAESG